MTRYLEDSGLAARTGIVEAVAYLNQCKEQGRRFAILTSEDHAGLADVLRQFTAGLPGSVRLARTPAPTDSSHAFLEAVLAEFGFDPFDASADDLLRLLRVVLRQAAEDVSLSVVIVEDAQLFGPRVLETIRDLAREAEGWPAPLIFVLTGSPALNRVMDSPGMAAVAHLSRSRYALVANRFAMPAVSAAESVPDAMAVADAALVVLRDRNEIGRFTLRHDRVLIGRGDQSDLRLPSRFVSRQHALLLRNAEGDWLVDLNSTNGTIVNSTLVERRRLAPGDVISIGDFQMRYVGASGMPQGPPATMPEAADVMGATVVMRSLQALHRPTTSPVKSRSDEEPSTHNAA